MDSTPLHAVNLRINADGMITDIPKTAGEISRNEDGAYIFNYEREPADKKCFLDKVLENEGLSQAKSSESSDPKSKKIFLTLIGFGSIDCALSLLSNNDEFDQVVNSMETLIKRMHEISQYVIIMSPALCPIVESMCPNYGKYMDEIDKVVQDVNGHKHEKETVFHIPIEKDRKEGHEWEPTKYNFQSGKDPHPNKDGHEYLTREIVAKLVQAGAIRKTEE